MAAKVHLALISASLPAVALCSPVRSSNASAY